MVLLHDPVSMEEDTLRPAMSHPAPRETLDRMDEEDRPTKTKTEATATTLDDLPWELVDATLRWLKDDPVAIAVGSLVCRSWSTVLCPLSGRLNMNARQRARLNRRIVLEAVARDKGPEVVEWLRGQRCGCHGPRHGRAFDSYPNACGELSLDRVIRSSVCLWCLAVPLIAARYGNIPVLDAWSGWHDGERTFAGFAGLTQGAIGPCCDAIECGEVDLCWAAAVGGSVAAMEWASPRGHAPSEKALIGASFGGHVVAMRWMLERGCPVSEEVRVAAASSGSVAAMELISEARGWTNSALVWESVAKSGSLPALEWIGRFATARYDEPALPATLCVCAAKSGNLEMIKWLRSRGHPLVDPDHPYPRKALNEVAARGHLAALGWYRENGFPRHHRDVSYSVWRGITRRGVALEALDWCVAEVNPPIPLVDLAGHAGASGRIDLLVWLVSHGCPCTKATFASAVKKGRLEAMRWLRANGCPIDVDGAMVIAAGGGRVETLAWLRDELGCPFDGRACTAAVRKGQIRAVEWLRENGCAWGEDTWTAAADGKGGQRMRDWLLLNGCPTD